MRAVLRGAIKISWLYGKNSEVIWVKEHCQIRRWSPSKFNFPCIICARFLFYFLALLNLFSCLCSNARKVLLLNWTCCGWSVYLCATKVRTLSTSQRPYCSSLLGAIFDETGSGFSQLLASSSSFLLKLTRSKEVPNKREHSSYFRFSPIFFFLRFCWTGLDHHREKSRERRTWVESLSCKEIKKSWLRI